jgi:hypothetical protein
MTVTYLSTRKFSEIPDQKQRSGFLRHAQQNASRRRDVRLQSRLFALRYPKLTRSPNSNRLWHKAKDSFAITADFLRVVVAAHWQNLNASVGVFALDLRGTD